MNTIKSAMDLITTKEDYKKGFSEIVVEKNIRILPYVSQCRSVQAELVSISSIAELTTAQNLHNPLLSAAGLSTKALKNIGMGNEEEKDLIKKFIDDAIKPSGEDFRNEISIRYNLIIGDSFGGHMRNVIGSNAKIKLATAIIGRLLANDVSFRVLPKRQKKFIDYDVNVFRVAELSAMSWQLADGRHRVLLFDKKSPVINKNIDLILLECSEDDIQKALSDSDSYIACGELKGGVDPAGADEHFKTAMSALERIRKSGGAKLFFVGAAIENAMAEEIFSSLNDGHLFMAANLNKDEQVAQVGNWLGSV